MGRAFSHIAPPVPAGPLLTVTAALFTALFLVAVAASLAVKLWLAHRQTRFVAAHRAEVPPAFADRIALAAHQKAADYTIARTRFGVVETVVEAALLLALTLGGGLAALVAWTGSLGVPPLVGGSCADRCRRAHRRHHRPSVFVREHIPASKRSSASTGPRRAVWIADIVKGVAVAAALGLPLTALILWLMRATGPYWWLWAWLAWIAFQFLVLALYPTVIAPLFNTFSPLPEGPARAAIEALLARCGFANKGLYVMDGSRRSSHGNAFFTGFGRAKRIVFFDTLLARLAPDEIEAVLAHELGHFRLHHVMKRMAWSAGMALVFLALLAMLASAPWFYEGLGVPVSLERPGVALLLFFLALPVFTFMLGPLSSLYSRRHEFEADAFAARNASADALVARARQAVRGQCLDVDSGSHLFRRLRFASARDAPHRASADDLRRPPMPRTVSAAVFVAFFFAAAAAIAQKQPAPFAAGDAKTGKALVERDCVELSRGQVSGRSGPDVHAGRASREDAGASSSRRCRPAIRTSRKGYFPEEEEHIAAYLNLEFYKFAP